MRAATNCSIWAATSASTAPARSTSHLQVGDTAIVVSDPDPVRARASAPDGQVVGTLYKNYQLPITGGPVCANSILWWEVTLRDGTVPGSPKALAMVHPTSASST